LEECQQEINALANNNLNFEKEARKLFRLIQELEAKDQFNLELNQTNQLLETKLNQLTVRTAAESKKNNQAIRQLEEIIDQKEELITNLREKLKELNKKQQKSRQSKLELEKTINNLFSEQSQKQIQISRQQGQISYLKNKNKELNQFQEQLLTELQSEQTKTQELKKIIKTTPNEQVITLTSELEQTQENLNNLENELTQKESKISLLEEKLTESQNLFQNLGQKVRK
jgi:TATA element modulatory factor